MDKINEGVTFIISARNEFPQLPMTITNLMMDCYQAGIPYEFIVADNGSSDNTTRFWKTAWNVGDKTSPFQVARELRVSTRGLVSDGLLRFAYDPIFSNVGARHKVVDMARYENIIFADGHISVKPNSIKYVLETLNKYGGLVHAPVAWMGADVNRARAGVQYSYKIGEKIWGTWNYAYVSTDSPFYIPLSGHCFLATKKQEYLDMRGYDTHQQIYGGGENFLDTKWWLLGSHVMADPRALVFHLSAGRGYSYNMNSLIHNMMLTAYTLGDYKWSERILLTYLNKPGTDHEFLRETYDQAIEEGKEQREFIAKNQIMDLEELLAIKKPHDCDGSCRGPKYVGKAPHAKRKWDLMNEELHGTHLSFVAVFDDWIDRLKDPEAIELYKNSPHQQE